MMANERYNQITLGKTKLRKQTNYHRKNQYYKNGKGLFWMIEG